MKKVKLSGLLDEATMEEAADAFETFSKLEDVIEARMRAPISRNELLSIRGIIAYRAEFLKVPEWIVRETFKELFKLEDIAELTRRDFASAIEYLVDLRVSVN